MLTCRSTVFACTREQARFVAECAGLVHVQSSRSGSAAQREEFEKIDPIPVHPDWETGTGDEWDAYNAAWDAWDARLSDYSRAHPHPDANAWQVGNCDFWQDRQTCGGAARVCWAGGIAWVSAHSGYAYADVTDEVCAVFAEIGCVPCTNPYALPDSPWIYGYQRYEESLASTDPGFVEAARKAMRSGD